MSETTAAPGRQIQEVPSARPVPAVTSGAMPRGLVPTDLDGVLRMARIAVGSGLMKNVDGDATAMAAMIIMKGMELGMSPTVALDSIALINGRTCVWGKAVPALVRAKGHRIREWETGTRMADDWTFHCEITRGDTGEVITRSFSVADAKQAQLWNQEPVLKKRGRDGPYEKPNDSPWFKYPQRMLPARARGYAAADGAPEALLGMYTVEEMQDVVRAEEIQTEERGALATISAPPPPALAAESAPDANGERGGHEPSEPEIWQGDESPTEVAREPPAEAPDHPAEETPKHIELAAVACAGAMAKAKTVKRLDDLMNAFGERFDGDIPRAVTSQLELIYEQNKARIEG
jgi:hypothetical protein